MFFTFVWNWEFGVWELGIGNLEFKIWSLEFDNIIFLAFCFGLRPSYTSCVIFQALWTPDTCGIPDPCGLSDTFGIFDTLRILAGSGTLFITCYGLNFNIIIVVTLFFVESIYDIIKI